MSEATRSDEPEWSRSALALAALGAAAIMGIAVAIGVSLVAAGIGALALLAIGVYFAAPRSDRTAETLPLAPAAMDDALPEAARAILEALDDPILLLDSGGRIVFANGAAHPLMGGDGLRKHISAVLRTPDVLEGVARVLEGGPPETIAFTFLVPVERHYEAYIGVSGREDGRPTQVLVRLHDLTALRRAEEMRADFVANASHELRTPLAAVTGFIDTLRGHAKNDSEARERFLEIMSVETGRMRRLIDDLLSLTRIELNEHNPPSDRVDLVAVVRDAAAALAPLAEADRVSIEVSSSAPLYAIGDRDELTQVFQNLIHNAIKYGRERGTVHIAFGRGESGKRPGHCHVFASVRDEGEGIPREAIPRLTERFYRVDVKRSRERGGTGLGLAIVKHILNRHHGRLKIESAPGEGSTFTVILPAADVPAA